MTYRVIQWSTGNVGHYALRGIVNHPQLQLVGLWVHSSEKAGRDAAELCGLAESTGVMATNDADALLALDADAVCYTATGDLRPVEALQDLAAILASGKNVVSSSLVPLVHPAGALKDFTARTGLVRVRWSRPSRRPERAAIVVNLQGCIQIRKKNGRGGFLVRARLYRYDCAGARSTRLPGIRQNCRRPGYQPECRLSLRERTCFRGAKADTPSLATSPPPFLGVRG